MASNQLVLPTMSGGGAEGGPSAGGTSRLSWRHHLRELAEQAYHRPDSRAYRVLFEVTTFLVLVSLLMMVLEGVPSIGEGHEEWFFYAEVIIAAVFIADYAGNVYVASSKRAYIFGFWGLVDLLAILPVFLSFLNIRGLRAARAADGLRAARSMRAGRALRALRMVRMVRVLKVAHRAAEEGRTEHAHGEHAHAAPAGHGLWRDFEFAMIGVCATLAITELVLENSDDHLFWLLYGTAAAVTFALRRLLVRQGRWALALAMAAIGLIGGIALYVFAQGADDPKAGVIALVTVLCTASTFWLVERPARLQAASYATGPA